MTIEINDSYINTLYETRFHKNQKELVSAIKKLLQSESKAQQYEYSLLKAYGKGDLSIGQVAEILSLSKNETMDLLQKYQIPMVNVDKAYLEQEFKAFD